jgi:hypothetical protein
MADTQNSTAIAATPVQQSEDNTATTTNPPATAPIQQPSDSQYQVPDPTQPQPDQSVDATKGPDAQTRIDQASAASNPSTQPQLQSGSTNPGDPTTAGTGTGNQMPLVPTQPLTAMGNNLPAPPAAHPLVARLLATARAFTQGAAGGPGYTTSIDPVTGKTTRTEQPLTGGSIAKAIALEALTGLAAGAGEHGPNAIGAAAAAGLGQGEKIAEGRKQTQEAADQKAQQDYVRQFEAFKTNLSVFESMQNAGKHDFDMANSPVELNSKYFEWLKENNQGKIGDSDVNEKDSLDVSKFPAAEYYRLPTSTQPDIDPETGQPKWQDIHGRSVAPNTPFGHPVFVHQYAMIHRDADAPLKGADGEVDPGLQAQMQYGVADPSLGQAAQDAKQPAGPYITGNSRVTTLKSFENLVNSKNGVISQVNHYRALVEGNGNNVGPNQYDTDKDSVYDLFGGNLNKMEDFIEKHEGKTQPDGSPSRSVRNNNPGNLVANKAWIDGGGKVDDKNLPPGQAPFRVYGSYEEGRNALDEQLATWQKENPDQSINSFFQRYTTPGQTGKDGLNDQQRYVQSALKANGAGDANQIGDALKPMANFADTVKNTPGAERAVTSFMRAFNTKNPKASLKAALDNMHDQREQAFIIATAFGNDPNAAIDYDSNRHNQQTQIMEMTRNAAKLKYNDDRRVQEESGILARNKDTIDAIVNGQAIDLRGILTMRAYDREIVTNELVKRTAGTDHPYSASSIQNMIDLNKSIADGTSPNSYGSQVRGYNTAFGHTGAAFDSLNQLKTLLPGQDISPFINKPIKEVLKSLQAVNPEAAKKFIQYQINLENATQDWQNLLHNGHVVPVDEQAIAHSILSDTTPFTTASAGLGGIMATSAQRIAALNEQYATTMSTGHMDPNSGQWIGHRAQFPNMLSPSTVAAVSKVADPETLRLLAHMQSGGTITGGPKGVGSEGREIGLMLTQKAPQQGASLPVGNDGKPTPQAQAIIKRYVDVYGNNNAEIKRAMQANGWK